MKIEDERTYQSLNSVQYYDHDSIHIQNRKISGSCIITPETIIENWPVTSVDLLNLDHFESINSINPEIIVLGTGVKLIYPDPRVIFHLQSQQIGIECMDTGAAIRCFNVLLSEQRNVCAMLIQTS